MVYIMNNLPTWYGFKLDKKGCFLEVFITEHAIPLLSVNADISQMFSLILTPHPQACSHWEHSVLWGLLEALWLLTKATWLSPWSCANQPVNILGPAPAFQTSPKIQANRKPWGRLTFPPLKGWYAFHTLDIIFATENRCNWLQPQGGWSPRCLHDTVKWNMWDHYPPSFKSCKC